MPVRSNLTFSVISKNVVGKVSNFEGAQKDNKNGKQNSNLNAVDDVIKDPSGAARQVKLVGDGDGQLNYSIKLDLLNYAPSFTSTSSDLEVQGEEFSTNSGPVQSQALKTSITIAGADARISITVKHSEIKANKVYRYHIISYPPQSTYQLPAWWSTWNIDVSEIASPKVNKDAAIDGSRTQNLSMFINGLWQANLLLNNPKIFDAFVYLRR